MATTTELANTPQEQFNLEAEYDQHLAPLVNQLMAKAAEVGIPIQVVAAFAADGERVGLASAAEFISAARAPLNLRAAFFCGRGEPEHMVDLLGAHARRQILKRVH